MQFKLYSPKLQLVMSTEQSAERLKVKDQSLPFAVCRSPYAWNMEI